MSAAETPAVHAVCAVAIALELERGGWIQFEPERVVAGRNRATPLGSDYVQVFKPLSQPVPLIPFLATLAPAKLSAFLVQRLAAQRMLMERRVAHMIVFKKSIFPRTSSGEELVDEATPRLRACWNTMQKSGLDPRELPPHILAAAWLLDLFLMTHKVLGGEQQSTPQCTPQNLKILLEHGIFTQYLALAAYQAARGSNEEVLEILNTKDGRWSRGYNWGSGRR